MLSTSKVAAAGLASATTAVLGSYFGVLGTVGAAAATSVISAVSSEVYQRSLDRTADRLRARGGARRSIAAQPERAQQTKRGPVLPAMIFGSLLIFALGMAVVSGVEYLRGAPLSGGSGETTTIGNVLHGTVSSTTQDVPVVGDLLGTDRTDDDSTSSKSSEHEKDREKPGLVNGILSGL